MAPVASRSWGPPDSDGVRVSYTSPARVERHRRGDESRRSVDTLLDVRRVLVVAWLKGGGASLKAKTLLGKAGNARLAALEAIDYLVEYGWAEVNEKRPRADWKIASLTWLDADALREALHLPRRDANRAHRADLLSRPPTDQRLLDLHASLSASGVPIGASDVEWTTEWSSSSTRQCSALANASERFSSRCAFKRRESGAQMLPLLAPRRQGHGTCAQRVFGRRLPPLRQLPELPWARRIR